MWKWMLIGIIAAFLIFGRGHALRADTNPPTTRPLSEVAKKASDEVEQYERQIDDYKSDYAKKVKDSYALLLKQLDASMSEETKQGNLEGALAIRAKIASLRESGPPIDPVGDVHNLDGVWHLRFNIDESDCRFDGNKATNFKYNLTTTIEKQGPSIVMRWSSGWLDRFTPVGDKLLLENWSPETAAAFPNVPCTCFGIGTRKQ